MGSPPASGVFPSSPPPPFSEFEDEAEDEDALMLAGNELEPLDGDGSDASSAVDGLAAQANDEDEDGEDLFGPGMERDYREHDVLDQYDAEVLDDADYEGMDPAARRAAEMRMRQRDRQEARLAGRLPQAFIDDDGDDDDMGTDMTRRRRRRRVLDAVLDPLQRRRMMEEEEARDFPVEALAEVKAGSLNEWLAMEGPMTAVRREFKQFLQTYVDGDGASVYGTRIRRLGELNEESLEVSFLHLVESKPVLAQYLQLAPAPTLRLFHTSALQVILGMWNHYERIHSEVHVRISDFPAKTALRLLRRQHLNRLIRVHGVVTRRTAVFPQMKYVMFECNKCKERIGPFAQDDAVSQEIRVSMCPGCQSQGPFGIVAEKTVYRNYQRLTLQEPPGTVPAGRLPRHREVVLLRDLVDSAKPGEEIEVTGIYRNSYDAALNRQHGFPVFSTLIEANHIARKEDKYAVRALSEEEERQILQLAKDPRIGDRIVKSIAPSIYGHEDIKTAIALALFGGVSKDIQGKHRLRGDINVLLLGDPGTAKSQFLKYAEQTAPRAVFTTGQGASAVGLTAAVRKDPTTREWTLEGGALVLADQGVCLIDEFDKMNDHDRTSIHEAMEQQSISISKAGIVTTLRARCAVLAAANPIRGRYDPTRPFGQNVELTEPILSRFDVLCVVRDTVDPVADELLARFVVDSHIRSHPEAPAAMEVQGVMNQEPTEAERLAARSETDSDILPQDLLRKYIAYARERCKPRLNRIDQDKISRLYSELRRESLAGGSIPITVRHVESIIRMSEARAKMFLRDQVRADDLEVAIRVALESFIGAQKYSVQRQLRRAFSRYVLVARDSTELLLHQLGRLAQERVRAYQIRNRGALPIDIQVPLEELARKGREANVHDLAPFLECAEFLASGFHYDAVHSVILKRM